MILINLFLNIPLFDGMNIPLFDGTNKIMEYAFGSRSQQHGLLILVATQILITWLFE